MSPRIPALLSLLLPALSGMAAAGPALLPEVEARIDASSAPAEGEPSLAELRDLTRRFLDVDVALAEGYLRDPGDMCDTAPTMGRPASLGVMGVHFFRPDLLGIAGPPNPRVDGTGTHTDFRRPAILIHEPQPDGALQLVAVENLVLIEAWEAAGNTAPPSFHGVAYDLMQDDPATEADEAHLFEPHYDRHVWLWREHPSGAFAQYNPAATCDHHGQGPGHAAHAG